MSLVIDASVALRWYVDAPGTAEATELLGGDELLIAPELVVAEVANAAWKLARAGEISDEHGTRIAAAIPTAFSALVSTARLSSRAYALARELDHPVCDCMYVALAELEENRLLAADRRLLGRLHGSAWEALAEPLTTP